MLEKRMMLNSSDLESVESEISILKSVLHPNISQLYKVKYRKNITLLMILAKLNEENNYNFFD